MLSMSGETQTGEWVPLPIYLQLNDVRYIRAETESGKVHLMEVSCQAAQREAAKALPLEGKYIAPGVSQFSVASITSLQCH